jgi:hypothetical protein
MREKANSYLHEVEEKFQAITKELEEVYACQDLKPPIVNNERLEDGRLLKK